MKKRVLSLILAGLLVIPMVGCNANIKLFGKEILSYDDGSGTTPEIQEPQDEYSEQQILNALITGEYTLVVDGQEIVYPTDDVLKAIYGDNYLYKVDLSTPNQNLVQISDSKQEGFVTFLVDMETQSISAVELYYEGHFLEGEDANNNFPYLVYEFVYLKEEAVKKEEQTKEEKKDNTSKEQPKQEKKQEKKQEASKTCKWCYTNKLPSGAGSNDKCSECQAENWNFYCNDCNKSLTLEEYWSYGHDTGFCPKCYDKYLKSTSDNSDVDHKHYYCDRCGRDITGLNFLQEFAGYDYICEGCLLDLGY